MNSIKKARFTQILPKLTEDENSNLEEFLWDLRRLCIAHRVTIARAGLKFCGMGTEFGVWTTNDSREPTECIAAVGSPLDPGSWISRTGVNFTKEN